MHQVAADFVLLQQHGDRLSRVDDGGALASALGVGRQCLLQLIGQSQVIDDQPALLVAEDSVHAGDGLHQSVAAHRLVGVHRAEAGGVEAGQPHIADNNDAERVFGVLESRGQSLAA